MAKKKELKKRIKELEKENTQLIRVNDFLVKQLSAKSNNKLLKEMPQKNIFPFFDYVS